MNILIKKIIITFFCIICINQAKSQTTNLSYTTSNLSTSACNVFNPAVSISGVQHNSLAGGVTFNSSSGLNLVTTPLGTPSGGTAFIVNYNFTPGNKYDITITAKGNNALFLKSSVVPNLN